MTPTDELPPFETRLLAELTDVVEDRQRSEVARTAPRPRRTRLAFASVGVAAVALALAIAPGLVRDPGSGAFAIRELEGGVIELDVFDEDLDGEALSAELAEFGIEVAVERWHASPSLVGRVEAFLGENPEQFVPWQDRPGISLPDPEGSVPYRVRIDPDVYDGEVVIRFFVATPVGEPYVTAAEVFEPGEILGGLHCALGEPVRAEQLVPYLDDLGVDVAWSTVTPHHNGHNDVIQHEQVAEVPDGEVMWGYAIDDATVSIEVRPDGVRFPNPADVTPRLSDEPCTPEQAAAWE